MVEPEKEEINEEVKEIENKKEDKDKEPEIEDWIIDECLNWRR